MKKSPVGSWRSFFNLGKSSSVSKRKLQRNPSEPSEMKAIALAGKAPFQSPRLSAVQSDVSSGFLSPSSVQAVHDTSSSSSFPVALTQGALGPAGAHTSVLCLEQLWKDKMWLLLS